uniref:Ion transport domain-containing protein n=1 Tax=Spongospora subterranea TaxID=70186 RepID=A0A0H5QUI7_9EUKA|eukprot:CRZ05570.1 hypothetical protein [Spongospora subterranea]
MHDCSVEPPYCQGDDCGNSIAARFYFITFQFLSKFIILNVFVAVVLQNFEDEIDKEDEDDEMPIKIDDIVEFSRLWNTHCRSDMMPLHRLFSFLQRLTAPMVLEAEFSKRHNVTIFLKENKIAAFEPAPGVGVGLGAESLTGRSIMYRQMYVHYVDVAMALTERLFKKFHKIDNIGEISEESEFLQCIRAELTRAYPARVSSRFVRHPAHEVLAAIVIQAAYRGYNVRQTVASHGVDYLCRMMESRRKDSRGDIVSRLSRKAAEHITAVPRKIRDRISSRPSSSESGNRDVSPRSTLKPLETLNETE